MPTQNTHSSLPIRCLHRLDRGLSHLTGAAMILVLPLALLLCAQWPLRDWLHAYSREANDLAQLLFGIYVSAGMTFATRNRTHLTPDVIAQRYPLRVRTWLGQCSTILIVLPWTFFILYSSASMTWQSVMQLEGFPDTFNPGYFILKISVMILALLVMLQAVCDIFLPQAHHANHADDSAKRNQ